MSIALRPATADDIDGVLAFWCVAAEPTSTDSVDALTALVRHHPGALILAEADGSIVGSVIAGWDGWRGSIYRLAVHPGHRRRGLARQLLGAAEARLTGLGASRLQAVVVETNENALPFWTASDWEQQTGQLRFAKG